MVVRINFTKNTIYLYTIIGVFVRIKIKFVVQLDLTCNSRATVEYDRSHQRWWLSPTERSSNAQYQT